MHTHGILYYELYVLCTWPFFALKYGPSPQKKGHCRREKEGRRWVLARSFSTVDAPPRFCRRPPKKSMPAAQKVARCARGGSCASASGEAAATFSVPGSPPPPAPRGSAVLGPPPHQPPNSGGLFFLLPSLPLPPPTLAKKKKDAKTSKTNRFLPG